MKPQLPFSSSINSSRSFATSADWAPAGAGANAAALPAKAKAPPSIKERRAIILSPVVQAAARQQRAQ